VDYRHLELHDLLCEALIALEGERYPAVRALLTKSLRWVEADWLATPDVVGPEGAGPPVALDDADEDD
jgi:hypothetical protein